MCVKGVHSFYIYFWKNFVSLGMYWEGIIANLVLGGVLVLLFYIFVVRKEDKKYEGKTIEDKIDMVMKDSTELMNDQLSNIGRQRDVDVESILKDEEDK